MDRVLKTKDINFIKTLLENCPDKVKNILTVNKQPEKRISDILALAKKNNINISFDQISRLEASYSPREVEDINSLEKILSDKKSPVILLLDHLQDPQNIGSIMRSSLGAGVDAIIVPKKRACHLTTSVREVSKGASELLPFIVVSNLRNTVKYLKENFIQVIACSGEAESNYFEIDMTGPLAFIMGSEEKGIQSLLEKEADKMIKIPIESKLESLNVSNATSVILFEAKKQRI
jgi:23S rRNA (guanosine2251-2'-O)-methyltransferase